MAAHSGTLNLLAGGLVIMAFALSWGGCVAKAGLSDGFSKILIISAGLYLLVAIIARNSTYLGPVNIVGACLPSTAYLKRRMF